MSQPSCDACSNLREYNAQFIMNGVSDSVAESLQNNTGFNSCLDELHTDCEDLNDANDCLLGHMDDDVDNFEVCDWKDFMHNLLPNLYEVIKAIIAAVCGLWTKLEKLEELVCALIDIVMGSGEGLFAEGTGAMSDNTTMALYRTKRTLKNACGEAEKEIQTWSAGFGVFRGVNPATGWSDGSWVEGLNGNPTYGGTVINQTSAGTVLCRWKTSDVVDFLGQNWVDIYGNYIYLDQYGIDGNHEPVHIALIYSSDKQYINAELYHDIGSGYSGYSKGAGGGKVFYKNYKDFQGSDGLLHFY